MKYGFSLIVQTTGRLWFREWKPKLGPDLTWLQSTVGGPIEMASVLNSNISAYANGDGFGVLSENHHTWRWLVPNGVYAYYGDIVLTRRLSGNLKMDADRGFGECFSVLEIPDKVRDEFPFSF